ncbi:protein-methionine-sulfoxide reductase catalytic subunit MsrP [Nodosilinea sp. LEGE 07088]|uniref:protein-methionine-sulfoxide reductase catalytic subunit MsrP n=1 Tax=Nodosilinea sp. LEGE 07088 TaxID=2777968 RepID=UPI00187ED73E|nr:protein-methionine-sulfoxide reductase catalytic subunit MsrP [Nodosilinea sp. LEGE 07088]MBE9137594.1 protein-methionine-sulfoxide reductase catalytic subunit MsrP [Nodosilinea sp. LEGE 07088]
MVFFDSRPDWQLSASRVTPERIFWQRRRFMKSLIGAGVGLAAASAGACQRSNAGDVDLDTTLGQPLIGVRQNPAFADAGRDLTEQIYASSYNNYYEFGGSKNIWESAQALPADPWQLEVGGLVKNPTTFDLDDLTERFDLEERIYRFRCVEAWAMVVPWIGFPMKAIMNVVEPTSAAKFVRFTSFYDPQVCPGPGLSLSRNLPWPYTEGLTIAEMANDLAFFAVGIYGRTLPKQHGAPIRMVTPWKYGFKGAKSIVKIEFVAEQPATYWNTLAPNEYKFEANVEPEVPHPRWSQATERLIGERTAMFSWEEQPTVIYNGYGDYVAGLYR